MKRWFSLPIWPAAATMGCAISPSPDPGAPPHPEQAAMQPAASNRQPTIIASASSPRHRRTLPANCQAPLAAIEEVSRFLVIAATHATASAACVDGPGRRVSIDQILVCPTRTTAPARGFVVEYTVTEFSEGDTRACRGACDDVDPRAADHRLEIEFLPRQDAMLLQTPTAVPGVPHDATPATLEHDGDCYGRSSAFAPAPIRL